MKIGIVKLNMLAAMAALALIAGSTGAWAQSCPTSPNYLPDFSSNQNCLALNNNGAGAGYPGFYPAVPPPPTGVTTVLRLTPNQYFWAGSAWYTTQQPVAGAFSTTFTFQLSGTSEGGSGNADGIAFLIQNSPAGTTALGPDGCGIGFGDDSQIGCTPSTGGIPNSLAVEFNSFLNSGIDPSASDVTIQNCSGTGPNSVDPSCTIAVNDLTQLANPINIADGNVHTVTINYSGPSTKLLDVILDNVDLFSGGVVFDLTTLGLANSNTNAWVGFTAATGGGDDNQDILSWTFTPQAQTAVVTTTSPATLSFPNAAGNNVYSYTAQLTTPYANPVVQVQPILMTAAACDALVQKNFWPARCFVYQNAENTGMDAAVMFAVTCPDAPGGTCGSIAQQNFFATLGTVFSYLPSDNPFFVYPGIIGPLNPFPGWLKGEGPNPAAPCTPPSSGSLFTSNQISGFSITGDPNGKTVGGSGGTGSCWVPTYDTPGEIWPGIKITSPKSTTYTKGQVVPATYSCNNPATSQPPSSPTGPYLTAAICTQATGRQTSCTQTGTGLSCTGTVDTSTKGLHAFLVTAIDSGGNQNLDLVLYNVK
jgi:Legume lectin domain